MDMNYRGGMWEGGGGQDGVEWGWKWDNCNSIINKYIKKKTTSYWKNLWGLRQQEKLSLTGEFIGEIHSPRMYTNPSTWDSAPEGPNLLVGSGGSD